MTVQLLPFESPYGCSLCGDEQFHHGDQWAPLIGLHTWQEPPLAVVLARMKYRHAARLAAEPAKYHAVTGWSPDRTGEEGIPYCADCKTDGCRPWMRVQDRLDRQRWQLSGMPHGSVPSGGWGGEPPW